MPVNVLQRGYRQSGQSLILFTMMISVFVGFLVLVVDLGFLFGQRRYDQNGADAGGLAVAQVIAGSVSPLSGGGTYISKLDSELYATALQYGGLTAGSTAPTGTNQNQSLSSRNQLEMTLEYSTDGGATWCYSRSSPAPPRVESQCAANTGFPPNPSTTFPYRVRATVSSTTGSFFGQLFEQLLNKPSSDANVGPSGTQTNVSLPACLRPAGANGMLTCAQAIGLVSGVPTSVASGGFLPVTTGDCQIGAAIGQLYQLWGSNPASCGYNVGSWKNTIDLSYDGSWCDGVTTDYKYTNLLPTTTNGQPYSSYGGLWPLCHSLPSQSYDHNWNRSSFQEDTSHPGQGNLTDFQYWIAASFHGAIRASPTNGNFLPTTCDGSGGCADWGQNIASAFYCASNQVSGDQCNLFAAPGNTYFFKPSTLKFPCEGPQGWTTPQVGCRTATVPTWGSPQWATSLNQGGQAWNSSGSGGPDRVMMFRLLNMRLYCQKDASGNCTLVPTVLGTGSGNSSVYGLFVSLALARCPTGQTCTGGPTVTGNVVGLGG